MYFFYSVIMYSVSIQFFQTCVCYPPIIYYFPKTIIKLNRKYIFLNSIVWRWDLWDPGGGGGGVHGGINGGGDGGAHSGVIRGIKGSRPKKNYILSGPLRGGGKENVSFIVRGEKSNLLWKIVFVHELKKLIFLLICPLRPRGSQRP